MAGDEQLRGSARSVAGIHIRDVLDAIAADANSLELPNEPMAVIGLQLAVRRRVPVELLVRHEVGDLGRARPHPEAVLVVVEVQGRAQLVLQVACLLQQRRARAAVVEVPLHLPHVAVLPRFHDARRSAAADPAEWRNPYLP